MREAVPLARGLESGAVALCAASLALLAYRPMLGFQLMGHDAYPLLATSTVQSPADLGRIFGDVHMAGRFWSDMYRPVLSLTMALDHALWGLDPFGYHSTTLVLFAGCGAALYGLVVRLTPGQGRRAAWIALGIFLLYPTHYEVLPAPARRGEVLCGLFALLTLFAHRAPRVHAGARPAWLGGAFALLAMGSKEPGYLVPFLAASLVFLCSPRRASGARLRHALSATTPAWGALAVALGARLLVVGGLGGHRGAGLANLGDGFRLLRTILLPQEVMAATPWAWELVGTCAIGVALALAILGRAGPGLPPGAWRAWLVALAWLAAMVAAHAYSGKLHRWYLFLPAIGWAMLTGPLLATLLGFAKRRKAWIRGVALAAAVPLAGLLLWQVRYSPLFNAHPEWRQASRALALYLDRAERTIRATPDGFVVGLGPVPSRILPSPRERRSRAVVHIAGGMRVDSFRAWTELAFPERRIEVRRGRATGVRPGPADRLTLLVPGERPMLRTGR